MPDSVPVVPIAAVAAALLLHAPLLVPSVSGVVCPVHTLDAPLMEIGKGFTVTCEIALQPVGSI